MKLEEMADVLDGLATTLEKFLGKTAVSDFHTLSACLRKFSGETVAAFCSFTVQAHEGKPAGAPKSAGVNAVKVDDLVSRIRRFLDHRGDYDYGAIGQIVSEVGKLKLPEIKAIGERVECHLAGRTKAALVSALENWLTNIKLSAEQSAFTLTGVGT
jgi:hypothetical protein